MHKERPQRKSWFPLIFSFILMAHLFSLVLRMKWDENKVAAPDEKHLIVNIRSEPSTKRQIVESSDTDNRTESPDAFLSDKTRFFDRQTKAKKVDSFQESSPGGDGGQGEKSMKLSDLAIESGKNPFAKAAQDYTKARKNAGSKGHGRTISSTSDYLEEIPPGDMTYLNTVEYKYYGFYHRIRQKLEQFWGRSIQEKAQELARAGRRVASAEEFITALQVTLDREGEIIAIHVKGTSGVKELDDAAIESFNEAGPFPNPPKDLIVDGKVTLEWGFVVKS